MASFRLAALGAATLIALVCSTPRSAHANLLVNGSFETWSGGDTSSSQQPDRIFNNGSLVVPGWNFAIGLSSDLYRDLNATGALSSYYDAADGDYLAGSGSFDTLHEGITQVFTVAPSTTYDLTFEMAPGGLNYDGAWIENASVSSSWLVELTGALSSNVNQSFPTSLADFSTSSVTNPLAWTPQSLQFTSDGVGGNVTLAFTAFGDTTHVFLDDVQVAASHVPEPSAIGLLAFTVISLGLRIRRRRPCRG